jgi:hypothetical protein
MINALPVIDFEPSKIDIEYAIRLIRQDKDNHFLAVSLNDSNTVSYSKNSSHKKNESKRVKTTIGRYLSRNFDINISCKSLSLYTNEVLKQVSSNEELESKIRILSSDEIMHFYESSDDPREDNGLHSCMTGDYAKYTKLYCINPDKVNLVTFGNRARALLWTTDDGTKVLDRYYPSNSKHGELLRQWAKNKGYVIRKNPDKLVTTGNVELSDEQQHLITLKSEHVYPYLDTFKFGYLGGSKLILSNYENFGNALFVSTEGDYIFSRCCCCKKDVSGDDRVLRDNGIFCKSCFDKEYFTCDGCKNIHRRCGYVVGDKTFCYDCYHDKYFTCCFCNKVAGITSGFIKVNSGYTSCLDCEVKQNIKKCEKCQGLFTANYLSEVIDRKNNIVYCCVYDLGYLHRCFDCKKYVNYDLTNCSCHNCSPELYGEKKIYYKDLTPAPDVCNVIEPISISIPDRITSLSFCSSAEPIYIDLF